MKATLTGFHLFNKKPAV